MSAVTTQSAGAAGSGSVRDRRRATLDRLTIDARSSGSGRARREETRELRRLGRRSRRRDRVDESAPIERTREQLAPPSLVWFGIIGVVAVLIMLGLVMVLSASAVTESNRGNSPYGVFLRQLLWAGIGLVGLVVAARMPYRWWSKLSIPLAIVGVGAMLVPFMPHVGATINGAQAWIRIGSFSIQPSELLKLVMVVVVADLFTRRAHAVNHRSRTLAPLAIIAAVGAGLAGAQEDLGSAIVLGSIAFAIAWIAGVPFASLGAMASVALLAAVGFILSSPARVNRFTAFLDVDAQKEHLAWQTYQGYVSIANGGVTGSGIGGSRTKFGSLPYAHSDFIFAIVADELGLIGAGAVVAGFLVLVYFGIQTALAAPDRFGMLLAGGIATWFGVQAIINLGGVTGLLPVTGLTLPFFSAGGSSLGVSMVAIGMLLSVNRRIGSRRVPIDPIRRVTTRRARSGAVAVRSHGT
ncbi:MAG: putative peptidoglycan glycosyltransferase FtsW [Actinomycetota bacterium]